MFSKPSRARAVLVVIPQILVWLAFAGHALAQGSATSNALPGKNIDIVGPTQPNTGHAGNVLMQQNEVAGATSIWKPNIQYAAFNDYRLVYEPDGGDAVIGFAYSRDYGRTWFSHALQGFSIDDPSLPPGGADANIVVLPGTDGGGVVLVNHMAFWRDESQAAQLRTAVLYEHNREVGPPATFLYHTINNTGNSSHFHDKPSFEGMLRDPAEGLPDIILNVPPFDGPPGSDASHDGYQLPIQAARVHTCFTKFVGNADGTKVECQYTDDLVNWSQPQKLSESVEINQGTSIALQQFGGIMTVCWTRFEDNNETAAIMCTKSTNSGQSHSKAEVVTEFCPPHWGTGPTRFRYNSLPIVVASGDDPDDVAIFFSSRNDARGTCNIKGKGNKPDTIGMSPVRFEDDFDSFDEIRNPDGSRNKDGFVRTSRNFARIMMVRQKPNGQWDNAVEVDPQNHPPQPHSGGQPLRKNFHQIMPACDVGGGTVTCTHFDTRLDRLNNLATPIAGGFIEDAILHFVDSNDNGTLDAEDSATVLPAGLYDQEPPPENLPPTANNYPLRRNMDLFALQISKNPASGDYEVSNYKVDPATWYADAGGIDSNSVRVSRFATRQDPDGPVGQREQVEFNFGGARLFDQGRAPFMSDYNQVWTLSAIKQQQEDGTTAYVPANGAPNPATDIYPSLDFLFNLGWTSNHMVRGKVFYTGCDVWDETLQMWVAGDCASSNALPEGALLPLIGEDANENPPMVCSMAPASAGPLTRNQTVMYAPLSPDIRAEVVSAIKGPTFDPGDPDAQPSTFVINISNGTRTDRTVMLSLEPGTSMRFDRQTGPSPLINIDVVVSRGSSNTRTVLDYGDFTDPNLATAAILTVSDGPQVLARLTLDRNTLVPLENVRNNPDECTDPSDPDTCTDLVDLLTAEFYELILKREILTTQSLDLENLDFENTADLLDFENLDFENLDLENKLIFLDFENLDFENLDLENDLYTNLDLENVVVNLDFENLDLENRLLFLDLENLDFENRVMQMLDFENLDFENLDLENLDFENLDFENLDFENLDFENTATYASDIENLDFENLDLENTTLVDAGDPYSEVSWTADSATNTITGVDVQPVFSEQLATALLTNPDAAVMLTVRKAYMTPTVTTVSGNPENPFCTPQVVAQNQLLYAALLTPAQITNAIFDGTVEDPPPDQDDTPGFFTTPDASLIISYRFFNLPSNINPHLNSGLMLPTQAGDSSFCDDETPDTEINPFCEFDFVVADVTEPEITGVPSDPPPGSPFALSPSQTSYHLEVSGISGFDDFDGEVDVVCTPGTIANPDPDPITYLWDFEVGFTTVTCTATDAAGNTATVSFTAEVVDEIPPVITAPANVVAEATGLQTTVAIGMATATDAFPVTVTNNAPATFPLGLTIVTWTATDENGNMSTASQSVTIVDTTAPTIMPPANVSVEATGPQMAVAIGFATAIDTVDASVVITNNAPATFPVGATVVTWIATDFSGNTSTAIQTITVQDTTAPVITVPADLIVEASGVQTPVAIGSATASDAVDSAVVISNDAPATFLLGITTVTWTATDFSGNSSFDTQTITVQDTTAPVITAPADMTVETLGLDAMVDIGTATATDAVGPVTIANDAPTTMLYPLGATTVTWTATDSHENSSTAIQTITVEFGYDVTIQTPNGSKRAGSTLPMDIYYSNRDTGQRVDPTGLLTEVRWFGPWSGSNCSGSNSGTGDGTSANDAGNSDFRISESQNIIQHSWKSPDITGWFKYTVYAPGTEDATECVRLR